MNNQWRDNSNKMVVWADTSYDTSRTCDACSSSACSMPVHTDRYREVGQTALEAEAQEDQGYWDWMHSKKPLGSSRDHDGETVTSEFAVANPDVLQEPETRQSGVSAIQHEWMNEAYLALTTLQRQVWDAVMREQKSIIATAKELDIDESAVRHRLSLAKQKVTEYLRMKQDDVA